MVAVLTLAAVLQAVAVEKRLDILRALAEDRYNVTELAVLLDISPSAVSSHARVLREANLVTGAMEGRDKYYEPTAFGHRLLDLLDQAAEAGDLLI